MYTVLPNIEYNDSKTSFKELERKPLFIVVKEATEELYNAFDELEACIAYYTEVSLKYRYGDHNEEKSLAKNMYLWAKEKYEDILSKFKVRAITSKEDNALIHTDAKMAGVLHNGIFKWQFKYPVMSNYDWLKVRTAISTAMEIEKKSYFGPEMA